MYNYAPIDGCTLKDPVDSMYNKFITLFLTCSHTWNHAEHTQGSMGICV